MRSTQILAGEFSQIGMKPEFSTSSGKSQIYKFEAKLPVSVELQNTIPIDDLIAEFEQDEVMAQSLAEARVVLANEVFTENSGNLSNLRLQSGFSQSQLAELVGTSQSHIARIEAGKSDPGTETIGKIARALNIEPSVVFASIYNQILRRA